jgi:hypothetical protein
MRLPILSIVFNSADERLTQSDVLSARFLGMVSVAGMMGRVRRA